MIENRVVTERVKLVKLECINYVNCFGGHLKLTNYCFNGKNKLLEKTIFSTIFSYEQKNAVRNRIPKSVKDLLIQCFDFEF